MRYSVFLLFLLTLLPPRPPTLSTRWIDATHAEIAWQSNAQSVCLWRKPQGYTWGYFLGCYSGSDSLILPGDGSNDGNYFPAEGDKYVAWFDEVRVETRLTRGWFVWLPLIDRGQRRFVVMLPLVQR